jgi:hypothetical protein
MVLPIEVMNILILRQHRVHIDLLNIFNSEIQNHSIMNHYFNWLSPLVMKNVLTIMMILDLEPN